MEKRAEDLRTKEPDIERMITEGEAGNGAEQVPEKERGKKESDL